MVPYMPALITTTIAEQQNVSEHQSFFASLSLGRAKRSVYVTRSQSQGWFCPK
jgi:hypothetical protein